MTANRNEIHHNWKQRPKNQHQKTKPPIQSNQQNMRYIELRENLMKQVENKKSNFEETPPEILSEFDVSHVLLIWLDWWFGFLT